MPFFLLLWFILNQAEIIPTDRLSRHLRRTEITTTLAVYIVRLQVCAAGRLKPTACKMFELVLTFIRRLLVPRGRKQESVLQASKDALFHLLLCEAAWTAQLSSDLSLSL